MEPPTLLAAMLRKPEEMMILHNRLKLSGFERDMALFVINHRNSADMKGNLYDYLTYGINCLKNNGMFRPLNHLRFSILHF